uniref:Uncharacterized protein n=1 Tax=Anguilla anguilla TaxID=7936 RepID=A0A0E9V2V8_ANGAN
MKRTTPESHLQPSAKHGGGSVQVLGCVTTSGGDLVLIEGTTNADKYKQIVTYRAIPSGQRLIESKYILQQDDDPQAQLPRRPSSMCSQNNGLATPKSRLHHH